MGIYRELKNYMDFSLKKSQSLNVIWQRHIVHYYSNHKPFVLYSTYWVEEPLTFSLFSWAVDLNPKFIHHPLVYHRYIYPKLLYVENPVPVHLRLVSSLFEALRSLQSKFSSQNSANHTFLRLFSRVRPVKYSSNPRREERGEWLSSGPIIIQCRPAGN